MFVGMILVALLMKFTYKAAVSSGILDESRGALVVRRKAAAEKVVSVLVGWPLYYLKKLLLYLLIKGKACVWCGVALYLLIEGKAFACVWCGVAGGIQSGGCGGSGGGVGGDAVLVRDATPPPSLFPGAKLLFNACCKCVECVCALSEPPKRRSRRGSTMRDGRRRSIVKQQGCCCAPPVPAIDTDDEPEGGEKWDARRASLDAYVKGGGGGGGGGGGRDKRSRNQPARPTPPQNPLLPPLRYQNAKQSLAAFKRRNAERIRWFIHLFQDTQANRTFVKLVFSLCQVVYCLCLSIKLDFPTAFKLFVSYLSFTGFDFLPSLALECALDMREWDYASKMVIVTLLPLACYVAIGTAAIFNMTYECASCRKGNKTVSTYRWG